MRLTVLENDLLPRGGQELSLLAVCRVLAARGHRIDLLYRHDGPLGPEWRAFVSSAKQVVTYSIDRSRFFASVREFISSLKTGMAGKPDIVYANQYQDSLLAAALARFSGARFVCHLRLPPPAPLCGQFRIGLGQASKLIAVSEHTRESWAAVGVRRDRIECVHNGIELDRYPFSEGTGPFRARFGLAAEDIVVTYAGRLDAIKGPDTLIRAFAQLKKNAAGARLVIAGREVKAGTRAELERLARGLAVDGSVRWIDHTDDIAGLFSASDVCVLPSRWEEPFGRVLIEAMAVGTPALGSRVGGIPEVLTGEFEKFLFPAGDADALAALLERTVGWRIGDPGLGRRARAHIEKNFSLTKTVDGIEAVLQKAKGR